MSGVLKQNWVYKFLCISLFILKDFIKSCLYSPQVVISGFYKKTKNGGDLKKQIFMWKRGVEAKTRLRCWGVGCPTYVEKEIDRVKILLQSGS